MPIATRKPTAEPVIKPNIPKIEGVENNSAIVDTKVTPLTSLVTYIEGMSYIVDYYLQVLTSDSAAYGQDSGQWGQYQQYRKIVRLELKVTSALSTDQEEETKLMSAKGTALVHSNVIPNIGDMFVADVGDGREGAFQVTRSEKKSIFRDSVYEIDYELLYFSEDKKEMRTDLESKVVATLHYVKDFMAFGESPLITTNEYASLRDLKGRLQQLINHYFDWFYSNEYATFTVPGQPFSTYDPFVVRTILSTLSTNDHPLVLKVRELNVYDDDYLKQPQFWEAIVSRDHEILLVSNEKMGVTGTSVFSSDPMYEGIRYSGIDRVIYPSSPARNAADYLHNRNALRKPIVLDTLRAMDTLPGDTTDLVTTNDTTPPANPQIYPVTVDAFYVLSERFYKKGVGKSELEIYTENYLQYENNDPAKLLALAKNVRRWGGLERFYYIPLLIILIKEAMKEV